MEIPLRQMERNKEIFDRHKAGEKVKDIAEAYNLNVTRVREIIERVRSDEIDKLLIQRKKELGYA